MDISERFYCNPEMGFFVDLDEVISMHVDTSISRDTLFSDFFIIVITFKNGTSIKVASLKTDITENNNTVTSFMNDILLPYLKKKQAHEQYKPDGAGYIEAKSEFETLKTNNSS